MTTGVRVEPFRKEKIRSEYTTILSWSVETRENRYGSGSERAGRGGAEVGEGRGNGNLRSGNEADAT